MVEPREAGVTVRADTTGFKADVEALDRNVLQPRERRLERLRQRLNDQQKRMELLAQNARSLRGAIRGQAITTGATIAFSQVAAGLGLDQSLIGSLGAAVVGGAVAGAPGGLVGAGLGALVAGLVTLTGVALGHIMTLFNRADETDKKVEAARLKTEQDQKALREREEAFQLQFEVLAQQERDALKLELEELNYRTALMAPGLQLR